ncbi:DEAD/DEAH box helicase family protein [Anaeropeptidivorans aminofermentans]|uniref:DEAD/DEAH box helicase family protein n=1 Tax=Anaeropeptidivorans aminofermentans TaxID=2934315 RepID=UPI0020245230|nr:DEAD/DEAH box helicase family protein [Anaeropeptidivorans aminofermentans]
MQTNFDFLLKDPQFEPFAEAAVSAERVLPISPALCATACRTALEFAVKWVYSVDGSLTMPYEDKLVTLISTENFKDLIPSGMSTKLNYLRKVGNNATHNPKGVSRDQAVLALQNLHSFLDFVAYCYGTDYKEIAFDKSLLDVLTHTAAPVTPEPPEELDFAALLDENFPKREKLTAKRVAQLKQGYTVKPMDMTEAETRKAYIDVMLQDAGWQRGPHWVEEYPIDEMPNKAGKGKADYVLLGDNGLPLAVIEAKRTSVNVEKGRQQAKLYADFLEKKTGQRPVIFLTNGYETRIWSDKYYPERQVSGIYSKRDLEKEFNKMHDRTSLKGVRVSDEISNRYYQKEAIQAVCDAFGERNRRKALLVMATGSGKTRTVISLVDVLIRHGWVKNVLFLADRNALVTQAKRAFHNQLPNLSLCNLTEGKEEASARAVFSTYQTMMNCIDATCDEKGDRLFTPGHFDLIIVDEAHRSIYNKYKDIFTYFDALLVGLTATPKDEIDKNTYGIFDLESGVPTYGYELSRAVKDGYLVDFVSIETELKFMTEGITYADLSPEEQEEYENTFADEDGNIPDSIDSSALNEWIFNQDTIKKALHVLMQHGQRVKYGEKIGKTIVFAKNHKHAEKILEVWNKEFPGYPTHYARVIDNYANYAQSLIDDFSDKSKFPQIAISVDMLDTGVDVPEILNLVFFKKVLSRAKFWQMIGRGTRICEGLIDGKDKQQFYIFDLCGNFDFFRLHTKGREAGTVATLQERTFNTKVEMVYKLQELPFQTERMQSYRKELVRNLVTQIKALPRENFAVKQHLRIIDKYQGEDDFSTLTYENTLQIAEHVAPLILPSGDDVSAARFDQLIYQIELAMLTEKSYKRAKNDVLRKADELSKYGTIPAIAAQKDLLEQILHNNFLERAGISDYEDIRVKLRDLIKFVPESDRVRYDTDFTDDILTMEWNESQLDNDDLAQYKKKVNYYILQHQDIPAIAKLKGNRPLTPVDVHALEHILWNELGTKEQYDAQYGKTPLGELVRSIVGLDQKAANEAFSRFLNDAELDSRQMYFVRQVVNYIVKNGMLKDLSVLQESPFTDQGSVSELFDDVAVFMDLRAVIEGINRNAVAA